MMTNPYLYYTNLHREAELSDELYTNLQKEAGFSTEFDIGEKASKNRKYNLHKRLSY